MVRITLATVGRRLPLTVFCLCAAIAMAAEPAVKKPAPAPPAPGCDFEAGDAWEGWKLEPPRPRESGLSAWESMRLEFLAPASGRATISLFLEGAGVFAFDDLRIYRMRRRRLPLAVDRGILNPGFETAPAGNPSGAEGWTLTPGALRSQAQACEGKAALVLQLSAPGRCEATQTLELKKGARYRLTVRASGRVTAGKAGCALLPGKDTGTALASETMSGSTLLGGTGKCGKLEAKRGKTRLASIELDATEGRNYTLQTLLRGQLGDRGRLHVELAAVTAGEEEKLIAARALARDDLGPDWRPLRLNFALRGARRLRIGLRLDGPAVAELDDLRLLEPVVIPSPKRFNRSDAGGNFRPRGRRPLITSRGKKDSRLVLTFTSMVGKRVRLPTAFWQFWRSGRAFDHQTRPFHEMLKRGIEDGSVLLLDASLKPEAKWLAGQAVTVPDRPGAYAISVRSKALIVAARGPQGFLAAASALGWLSADGPEPEVCGCQIEDWPSHEVRAAELSFDGRLADADRQLVSLLGTYRICDLVVTGNGFCRLSDSKTRSEARDLLAVARSLGLRTTVFVDALGAAPALAEKSPQSVEMIWHREESHYLRGTERSFLAGRNVVPAAGAAVEVTSERGRTFAAGKDYRLEVPSPHLGAPAKDAPRSWLRRIAGSRIPDGARILISYNALPPSREVPAACPRAFEALDTYRKQLGYLENTGAVSGLGIGGRLPKRMRTDMRTAGTRFKNGRLVADRVRELVATTSLAAPRAKAWLWGDLLNPCGGLDLPEDSPAASAELIDPAVRRKLTVLVRLDRSDAAGLDCTARSARFLLSHGYDTVAWCGTNIAAARAWTAEFARWRQGLAAWKKARKERTGRPLGMTFSPRGARILELENFASAAWCGAQLPGK